MATPNTVDWVTPQEFQGINTDVTEMESSSERLRSRGSSLFFLYKFRKRFPHNNIERYWSPVQQLMNNPLPTVAETVCRRECILVVNALVIVPSILVPINMPPKVMAQSTR